MKSFKRILLVCMVCLVAFGGTAKANDPWFNLGRSIGSSLNFSGGIDEKDFHYNKKFNFASVKTYLLAVSVPKGCEKYVSNPYITSEYQNILAKEFKSSGIKFVSIDEALNEFSKISPPTNYPTVEAFYADAYKFISVLYPIGLYVNIYAYSQHGNRGDVFLDFTISSVKSNHTLFYYKDMRMQAPRSWKEGMINRITSSFKNKLMKAIDKTAGVKP